MIKKVLIFRVKMFKTMFENYKLRKQLKRGELDKNK